MGKQMDNWLKVGSFNKKDEYYTPEMMVYPIMEYLKTGSTIWCPFDTVNSEFVNLKGSPGDIAYFLKSASILDFRIRKRILFEQLS
jgi:hypothetical protein